LPKRSPDPRRLVLSSDGELLIHVVHEKPQTVSKNVGLMSLKAGTHQLNLTNSIEAAHAVKHERDENTTSHHLLWIHYFFVSRSQ